MHVAHAMGASVPSDVVWTTSVHPVIVSQRVVDLLSEHRVSGWSTFPVLITTGSREIPLHGLVVSGRCGPVNLSRSSIALRQYPGGLFPHFLGHFFNPDSWDGADIFMESADGQGATSSVRFVTARVTQLFKKHRITNFHLTSLSDVSVSTSNFEIGRPYLIPSDFKSRVRADYFQAGAKPPVQYQPQPERAT